MTVFNIERSFVDTYRDRQPAWGFESGPNSIGEITYFRTYSRTKDNGTNERWHETVQRVVNGTFEILRRHHVKNDIEWDEAWAQATAQDMYDRIFNFKFTPPGRGLWIHGTDYVLGRNNGAPLNNCGAVSTEGELAGPLSWAMDMSMLGVGIGFDTKAKGLPIYSPARESYRHIIEDTREGWVDSVKTLVEAYTKGAPNPEFDYSYIRKAGEPIRGFGGVASGPGPLKKFHERIRNVFEGREGETVTSTDVVDLFNMMGACVVAGNVRRTALIALGEDDDEDFLDLKDYNKNPERAEWGWSSNNSLMIHDDTEVDYDNVAKRIVNNGEPGLIYIDDARRYGRMGEDKLDPGTLVNPCAEQVLESYELCTLVEVYPTNAESQEDFIETLRSAYLYAKAVTLIETHDDRTNAVMAKNRRVGTSISGVVQFAHRNGWNKLVNWMENGYNYLQALDKQLSAALQVEESIRTTTVKPSGTVSLLAGATPGVHFPIADYYKRRIRLQENHPLVEALSSAGYYLERDTYSDNTVIVEIPVKGEGVKTEHEASIREKADIAQLMARHWADNSVSVTLTFDPETEAEKLADVIRDGVGKWKSVSFLPIDKNAYAQMPYEEITEDEYWSLIDGISRVDFSGFYGDGEMEEFCTTDYCEVKLFSAEEEPVEELVA